MVRYFTQDCTFLYKKKAATRKWLKFLAGSEMKRIGEINIIFCPDPYILKINLEYLHHDYFTDIITFDNCEGDTLSGDLFISVDTVKENAQFYGVEFADELDRVIVHGLLHLIGYDDGTEEQAEEIHRKEDYYLLLRSAVK